MVWYGMVWYGMVWYGMVWYGMVWYGMVWYGMVWYGSLYGRCGKTKSYVRHVMRCTTMELNMIVQTLWNKACCAKR